MMIFVALALGLSGVARASIHAPSCCSRFQQAFDATLAPSADASDLRRLFGDFGATGDRSTRIGVGMAEPLDGFLLEFLRGIGPLFDREGDLESIEVQTETVD